MTNLPDPLREFDRAVNSMFNQFASSTSRTQAMPMDLYRDGESFILAMDLPGVDPTSIDVDIEERTLTIRAERHARSGADLQWFARERQTGAFARQLTLCTGIVSEVIIAAYPAGFIHLI